MARFDETSWRASQRRAYDLLGSKQTKLPNGNVIPNKFYVRPESVTMPAALIQEQPFVNSKDTFVFSFTSDAPVSSATLGNVVLGKTNVFAVYGLQLLIGEGATANNRIYRSRGITQNDDSIYNSNITITTEQSTPVDFFNGQNFRDVGTNANEFWAYAGMSLINPLRVVNGSLGKFNVTITLYNSISGLVLTPNCFLSMRLVGGFGQPSGI